MKKLLISFATLLVVLCATSTAFAEMPSPAPTLIDVPQITIPNMLPSSVSVMNNDDQAPSIVSSQAPVCSVNEGSSVKFRFIYLVVLRL